MKHKISVFLLSLGCLFSTSIFSATQHIFQMGPTIEYELPVSDPQVFSNIFMWTVKASCIIKSNEPNNTISFRILRKTGTINDINLTLGDTMTLIFHPQDTVYITALPGAKVELINQGSAAIIASCIAA